LKQDTYIIIAMSKIILYSPVWLVYWSLFLYKSLAFLVLKVELKFMQFQYHTVAIFSGKQLLM